MSDSQIQPEANYINVCCIDYRYDALTTEYFQTIGLRDTYFLATTAGAALCLGYEKYCSDICNKKSRCCKSKKTCDPENPDMELLKESLAKNIEIALSLKPNIQNLYLLNHQDCGAFKAFLSCSGYPDTLGGDNRKEIEINTKILIFAKKYIERNFPNITNIRLGLIDVDGSVADLDVESCTWIVQTERFSIELRSALWFGIPLGGEYHVDECVCHDNKK
jgi:hypothetical protein